MSSLIQKSLTTIALLMITSLAAQAQNAIETHFRHACDGGEGSPSLPNPRFITTTCIGLNCVKGGHYDDVESRSKICYPLLLTSQDGGITWTKKIHNNRNTLPVDFANDGLINNLYCDGDNCFALGLYYGANDHSTSFFPLLLQTSDWFQTLNYKPLVTKAQHPFLYHNGSSLVSMTCNGNICVAVGTYDAYIETINKVLSYPLIVNSTDKGATWTVRIDGTASSLPEKGSNDYPKVTLLPPDFVSHGIFNGISCNGLNCVAVGHYSTDYYVGGKIYPLVAYSKDGGTTWSYSINSNKKTLPHTFNAEGTFDSVHCKDNACIAAGHYQNESNTRLPLLASSYDSGESWTYDLEQ